MGLTEHQRTILNHALANDNRITKKEAVSLIDRWYYCNADKHVGDVLSRMVNSGLLTRESPGKFLVGKGKANRKLPQLPTQPSLF